MRTRFLLQGIGRIRRLLSGRAVGASMLWAIGALVVLGAVGAGIALMSPSALQSKLEQEAGMRAYYNANAGLNFLKSMRETAESQKIPFANYIAMMGGTSNTTYVLSNDDAFYYKFDNVSGISSNGSYELADLGGIVMNSAGKAIYTYVIYGNGKYIDQNYHYDVDVENGKSKKLINGVNINITASGVQMSGDVSAQESVSIANDSKIVGSIDSGGDITLKSRVSVTGYLCSQGSIDLQGTSQNITGNIRAAKDVVIASAAQVDGSILAGGDVTIKAAGGVIYGNIDAKGDVVLSSAVEVRGSVVAGGNVVIESSGVVVKGSVQAGNNVTIKSKANVDGDVVAGGSAFMQSDSISIGGKISALQSANFSASGGVYNGEVIAGTGIAISQRTTISANVQSGGGISITGWRSCIQGVAKAIGAIENCSGAWCGASANCYIGSRLSNQESVDSPENPETPKEFTPCDISDLPNPPKNTRTDDGLIKLGWGEDKDFEGGTYYYSSINMSGGGTIKLDLSGEDITIFSTGPVVLGNSTEILVSTDGSTYKPMSEVDTKYAAKVYLESNDNIALQWGADWFGTLLARGTLSFSGKNTLVGSYASLAGTTGVLSGNTDSNLIYVESNYAKANW